MVLAYPAHARSSTFCRTCLYFLLQQYGCATYNSCTQPTLQFYTLLCQLPFQKHIHITYMHISTLHKCTHVYGSDQPMFYFGSYNA